MAKHVLQVEYDYDFFVLAISCHEPDYKLCLGINKALNIELLKEESIELKNKKQVDSLCFSFFSYFSEEDQLEYHLFGNRSHNLVKSTSEDKVQDLFSGSTELISGQTGYLLPELPEADYLLVIRTAYDPDLAEELEGLLHSVNYILNLSIHPSESLSSKKNLIV